MVDWTKTLKTEYDYARGWLTKPESFAADWQPLVRRLHALMASEGFAGGEASALAELRVKVAKAAGSGLVARAITEDRGILEAVGAWSDNSASIVDAKAKMRAAAIKLLRHVYLVSMSNNRNVWVLSLPNDFRDWPSDDLNSRADRQDAVRPLLASSAEIFTQPVRQHLAAATGHGLAWCHRTSMVLAQAANGFGTKPDSQSTAALAVVKRWFADPGLSDNDLKSFIATLSHGFKNITAQLNKGQLVFTDWVPLRGASARDELDYLNAEAFTFASRSEGMDVVYIERSFFKDHPGNVLQGDKNWTRIVVHELTHLVCGTKDVQVGQTRYAWYGIGPHVGFPGSAAIRNADSWAFFSADCAGVLTDVHRAQALKII